MTRPIASILSLAVACSLLSACGGRLPLQTGPIALTSVPVSHGKTGAIISEVAIREEDFAKIRQTFTPPAADPHTERIRIATAVAEMERLTGEQLPTRGDLALNQGSSIPGGATDCIDESTNATTYAMLLQQQGLLRWHRVNNPATRLLHALQAHCCCVLEEITPPGVSPANGPGLNPGSRWSVDSWYGANGEEPMIMPLDDWYDERVLPLNVSVVKPTDSKYTK